MKKAMAFEAARLRDLFQLLQTMGYRIAGPHLQNEAIGFGFLELFEQLPVGYWDEQEPGRYRLRQGSAPTFFQHAVGPQSIKTILHPARRKLWEASSREGQGIHIAAPPVPDIPIALFGIRACDIKALHVLDKVFQGTAYRDPHYSALREKLLIVAVGCAEPSAQCFCTSMGYGPDPEDFDIKLIEVYQEPDHYFVTQAGSDVGHAILERMMTAPAGPIAEEAARKTLTACASKIKKQLNTQDLPAILNSRPLHSRWDEVATRCLSCGNCTMVCPTCFCTTTEDISDLSGDHTERWLHWDSCFTADFSYIHGGSVRKSTGSRYRQWLTHKLATWHHQFGSSGCVGCGRCIAWCPVGIDITEEATAIRSEP